MLSFFFFLRKREKKIKKFLVIFRLLIRVLLIRPGGERLFAPSSSGSSSSRGSAAARVTCSHLSRVTDRNRQSQWEKNPSGRFARSSVHTAFTLTRVAPLAGPSFLSLERHFAAGANWVNVAARTQNSDPLMSRLSERTFRDFVFQSDCERKMVFLASSCSSRRSSSALSGSDKGAHNRPGGGTASV